MSNMEDSAASPPPPSPPAAASLDSATEAQLADLLWRAATGEAPSAAAVLTPLSTGSTGFVCNMLRLTSPGTARPEHGHAPAYVIKIAGPLAHLARQLQLGAEGTPAASSDASCSSPALPPRDRQLFSELGLHRHEADLLQALAAVPSPQSPAAPGSHTPPSVAGLLPRLRAARVFADGTGYLIMEDLSSEAQPRALFPRGLTLAEAEAAVWALGGLHRFAHPRLPELADTARLQTTGNTAGLLAWALPDGVAALRNSPALASVLEEPCSTGTASIGAACDWLLAASTSDDGLYPPCSTGAAVAADTLVHGDLHSGNLLFVGAPVQRAVLVDWQCCKQGCGLEDLAFLLLSSLPPATRRQHTPRLLKLYAEAADAADTALQPGHLQAHFPAALAQLVACPAWWTAPSSVAAPGCTAAEAEEAARARLRAAFEDAMPVGWSAPAEELERSSSYIGAMNGTDDVMVNGVEENGVEANYNEAPDPSSDHTAILMEPRTSSSLLQQVGDTSFSDMATVVVRRNVPPAHRRDFEAWVHRAALAAKTHSPTSHLGTNIIRPGKNSNEYIVLYRFANQEALEVWEASAEKQALLEELTALLKEDAKEHQLKAAVSKGWLTTFSSDELRDTDAMSDPVTVVIKIDIKPSLQEAYEAWLGRIAHVVHSYPGHISTSVIRPKAGSKRLTYTVLYQFDCYDNLERWHQSEDRKNLLEERRHFICPEGQLSMDMSEGWSTFFDDSGPQEVARLPPPKYRMFFVTFFSVWMVVTLLSLKGSLSPTIGDELKLKDNPGRVPLAVLITLSVAIPLIFYLVVPVLVILLRPWLFNTSRRPTPPGSDASRLKRFLFGWFVG